VTDEEEARGTACVDRLIAELNREGFVVAAVAVLAQREGVATWTPIVTLDKAVPETPRLQEYVSRAFSDLAKQLAPPTGAAH